MPTPGLAEGSEGVFSGLGTPVDLNRLLLAWNTRSYPHHQMLAIRRHWNKEVETSAIDCFYLWEKKDMMHVSAVPQDWSHSCVMGV